MPTDYNVEATLRAHGVEVLYSTPRVAKMFGKTRQWVQWMLAEGRILDREGNPVVVARTPRGHRTWTAEDVKSLAVACYNQKMINMDELKSVIRKLLKDSSAVSRKF